MLKVAHIQCFRSFSKMGILARKEGVIATAFEVKTKQKISINLFRNNFLTSDEMHGKFFFGLSPSQFTF